MSNKFFIEIQLPNGEKRKTGPVTVEDGKGPRDVLEQIQISVQDGEGFLFRDGSGIEGYLGPDIAARCIYGVYPVDGGTE